MILTKAPGGENDRFPGSEIQDLIITLGSDANNSAASGVNDKIFGTMLVPYINFLIIGSFPEELAQGRTVAFKPDRARYLVPRNLGHCLWFGTY